jgi:hypothetical protein
MERLVGNKTKIKKRAIGHTKPFLGELRMFLIRRGTSRCATCTVYHLEILTHAWQVPASPLLRVWARQVSHVAASPASPARQQSSRAAARGLSLDSSVYTYVRIKLYRLEYCCKLLYILRQIDSHVGLSRKFPEVNFQNFAKVQFCWIFLGNLTVLGKISSFLSKFFCGTFQFRR